MSSEGDSGTSGSQDLGQLGRYELLATLGEGQTSTVYLARQRSELGFQRLVAIKRLLPLLGRQAAYVKLLRDEARIGAGLNHANLVASTDVGEHDGSVYLVMDYVEGDSLEGLVARAGAEHHARYLIPIFVDALSGLHAAHTALGPDGEPMGLVHQAPRPEHLLVGIDGITRLVDFSQVRSRSLDRSPLRADRLKVAHMAPEQVLRPDEVDHRADVFILGTVLWEVLTGKTLFAAETEEQAFQNLLHRMVPPPSTLGHRPPECLDAICMRALQRDPAHRYPSAAEMARELRDTAINHALFATAPEVGQWVKALCGADLLARRRLAGGDTPSQQVLIDTGEGSGLFEARRHRLGARALGFDDEAPTSQHRALPDFSDPEPDEDALTNDIPVWTDDDVVRVAEDTARLLQVPGEHEMAPSAFTDDAAETTKIMDARGAADTVRREELEDERPTFRRESRPVDGGYSQQLAKPSRKRGSSLPPAGQETPMYGVHHSVVESIVMDGREVPRGLQETGIAGEGSRRDSVPGRLGVPSEPVGDVFRKARPVASRTAAPVPVRASTALPVAPIPTAPGPSGGDAIDGPARGSIDSLEPPSQAQTLPPESIDSDTTTNTDGDPFRAPRRSSATWLMVGAAAAAVVTGAAWTLVESEPGAAGQPTLEDLAPLERALNEPSVPTVAAPPGRGTAQDTQPEEAATDVGTAADAGAEAASTELRVPADPADPAIGGARAKTPAARATPAKRRKKSRTRRSSDTDWREADGIPANPF